MQVVAPSHGSSVKVLIAVTADFFCCCVCVFVCVCVCGYILFASGSRLAGFTEEEKI